MSKCNGREGNHKCNEPCNKYYVDDNLPLIRGYCDRHMRQKIGSLIANHKAHSMVEQHQHIMAYGIHASMPSGMSYCRVAVDDIDTAKRLQKAILDVEVYRQYDRDYMDIDLDYQPRRQRRSRPIYDDDSDSEAPAAIIVEDRPRPPLRRANATLNYKNRRVVSVISDDEDDSFVVSDNESIPHESWSSDDDQMKVDEPDEPPARSVKRYRTIYD